MAELFKASLRPVSPEHTNIVKEICREVDHLDNNSETMQIITSQNHEPLRTPMLILVLKELNQKLDARATAIQALADVQKDVDIAILAVDPTRFAARLLCHDIPPPSTADIGKQLERWELLRGNLYRKCMQLREEVDHINELVLRVSTLLCEPAVMEEPIRVRKGCRCKGREEKPLNEHLGAPFPEFVEEVEEAMTAEEAREELNATLDWLVRVSEAAKVKRRHIANRRNINAGRNKMQSKSAQRGVDEVSPCERKATLRERYLRMENTTQRDVDDDVEREEQQMSDEQILKGMTQDIQYHSLEHMLGSRLNLDDASSYGGCVEEASEQTIKPIKPIKKVNGREGKGKGRASTAM